MAAILSSATQHGRIVGHQVSILSNHLVEDWLYVLGGHAFDVVRTHGATALQHRYHGCLVMHTTLNIVRPFPWLYVWRTHASFSAYIGFVHFHDTREHRFSR